jgi:hypothetical protein
MVSLAKALEKLHMKNAAKDLENRARVIIENYKHSLDNQAVDVLALRHQ